MPVYSGLNCYFWGVGCQSTYSSVVNLFPEGTIKSFYLPVSNSFMTMCTSGKRGMFLGILGDGL